MSQNNPGQRKSKKKTRDDLLKELNAIREKEVELLGMISEVGFDDKEIKALHDEVNSLRAELRNKDDELQVQKEELRVQTEELESQLEELRSTNDELECSIQQRKVAEESLRESEQRFRATFEQAAVGIAQLDLNGRFIRVNQKCCDMLGYTMEELLHRTFQSITYPEDLGIDVDFSRKLSAGEIPTYSIEKRYIRKDGSMLWALLTMSLERVPDGSPLYFIKVVQDITVRKQAEQKIEHLASFPEMNTNPVIEIDAAGTIKYANPAASRLFPDLRSHGPPHQMLDGIGPGILKQDKKTSIVRDVLVNGIFYQQNIFYLPESRTFRIYAIDITERKQAEENIVRLAAIVESSEDAIISKTLDGIITSWNSGAERMFVYAQNEVLGKSISILIPPDKQNELPYILNKIKAGERIEHYDTVRARNDGSSIDVSISVSPIKNSSGRIIGASTIARDITERKKAEKELQEKQEELEAQAEELKAQTEELLIKNDELESHIRERKRAEAELSDAKNQAELYLDLMGHDISNMHQIIMGQLELAKEIIDSDGKLEAADRELIDTSISTLERSALLIENVRNLQKLRSGEFEEEVIDLDKLLADVIIEFEKILPGGAIKFERNGPYPVKANKLLHDVFANLIGNAIKHSNGNNITIAVDLKKIRWNDKDKYMVRVEDNGPGIPDDLKDKIFNRLQRGETKVRGMGLGLFLVKSLVDCFNGKVWVEDRVPGDYMQGSRFVVILPVEG